MENNQNNPLLAVAQAIEFTPSLTLDSSNISPSEKPISIEQDQGQSNIEAEQIQIMKLREELAQKQIAINAKIIAKNEPSENEVNDIRRRVVDVAKTATKENRTPGQVASERPRPRSNTFYPDMKTWVEIYLSKVYATQITGSSRKIWINDWWKYPGIVDRLQVLWLSWERAYKEGTKAEWFLRMGDPMMHALMDKDNGIIAHYAGTDNLVEVRKVEALKAHQPPRGWLGKVAVALKPPEKTSKARSIERKANNVR